MKNELISATNAYFAEQLRESGFRRRGGTYEAEIEPGFVGRISLNISGHRSDGLLGLSPLVAVESVAIRLEINRLLDQKKMTPQPSLSSALGYLMPDGRFLEWLLKPSEPFDQREEVPRMCLATQLYGVPFIRLKSSFTELTHSLETLEYCFKERAVYHLPVVYRLNGQEERGRSYIVSRLQEIESKYDIAANEFRSFASNFLRA